MTPDDLIKRLHESSKFQQALKLARSPVERASVAAAAEQFVSAFSHVLSPLVEKAKNDPKFADQLVEQLARRLKEGQELVTTNEPEVTGSVD